MNSKSINTIIPAAGKTSSKLLPVSSDISNAMIPIHGQPIIKWIIDELIDQNLKNITIAARYDDEHLSNYVHNLYDKRANIKVLKIKNSNGLADTLYQTVKTIKSKLPLLIVLGDTIFKDKLQFNYDWVKYSEVNETFRWCIVELDKKSYVKRYIDKPRHYNIPAKALVGLYFLKNKKLFKKALEKVIKNNITIRGKTQISSALKLYSQKRKIKAELLKQWFDCGSIDKFHETKRKLMQTRNFNKIKVDSILGTITKKSRNKKKFIDEINWYLKLPQKLKPLVPRVLDYSISEKEPQITMEYYGYTTLSELWVYHHLNPNVWKSIIKKLFEIISIFKKHRSKLNRFNLEKIYWKKTIERLNSVSNPIFKKNNLKINGKEYQTFYPLKDSIKKHVNKLIKNETACVIHGDLCFANILYDLNSQIIKLIDPRGSFGKKGIYGDMRYDMAKLRHSIKGNYDFIINDLFRFSRQKNNINYSFYTNNVNIKIGSFFDSLLEKQGYDTNTIKFIEGLLFISMVPLHPERIERQIIMYSQGIKKINEVLDENSN